MIGKPSIIDCDGIIFITMPFPHGEVRKLLPSWERQRDIGIKVDLRAAHDNDYFMVTMSRFYVAGVPASTHDVWNKNVLQVVEDIWNEMVDRGIVNGTVPEIIKGNPLDMVTS